MLTKLTKLSLVFLVVFGLSAPLTLVQADEAKVVHIVTNDPSVGNADTRYTATMRGIKSVINSIKPKPADFSEEDGSPALRKAYAEAYTALDKGKQQVLEALKNPRSQTEADEKTLLNQVADLSTAAGDLNSLYSSIKTDGPFARAADSIRSFLGLMTREQKLDAAKTKITELSSGISDALKELIVTVPPDNGPDNGNNDPHNVSGVHENDGIGPADVDNVTTTTTHETDYGHPKKFSGVSRHPSTMPDSHDQEHEEDHPPLEEEHLSEEPR